VGKDERADCITLTLRSEVRDRTLVQRIELSGHYVYRQFSMER
jgi:hypothetical protein